MSEDFISDEESLEQSDSGSMPISVGFSNEKCEMICRK